MHLLAAGAAGMGCPDACQGQMLAALPPGQSPSRTKRASGLVLTPSMQTLLLLLLVRGLIWRMRAKALAHACLQVSMHCSLATAEMNAVAREMHISAAAHKVEFRPPTGKCVKSKGKTRLACEFQRQDKSSKVSSASCEPMAKQCQPCFSYGQSCKQNQLQAQDSKPACWQQVHKSMSLSHRKTWQQQSSFQLPLSAAVCRHCCWLPTVLSVVTTLTT